MQNGLQSRPVPATEIAHVYEKQRTQARGVPWGAPVIRSEVVAIDPSPLSLERARAAGFTIAQERTLDGLDVRLVVLRAPTDERTRRALARLRKLDPDGQYDFNHLYTGSAAQSSAPASPATARKALGNSSAWRVGLIDTGVDRTHPALADAEIRTWGCDGVVMSTPTGSTAYAFSGGGPVVWPQVEALLLVPISAHALFARPLVLGPDTRLAVEVVPHSHVHGVMWCDGRRTVELPPGARIEVRRSQIPVRLVRFTTEPFTDRLVAKFALPVTEFELQSGLPAGWRVERQEPWRNLVLHDVARE